jgi:ABC-2 type transport system ATP-binding protein
LDEIRSLIKNLGKNKTVMLSTHIMQEVESICDRIVIINNGNIVADRKLDDNKESKKEQKEQKLLVEFEQKITLSELKNSFPKASIKSKENQWVFTYDGKEDLRKLISRYAQKNDLLILEMQQHTDNLEDLFKKLTK